MRDRQAPLERKAVAQSFVANAKELLSLCYPYTHAPGGPGGPAGAHVAHRPRAVLGLSLFLRDHRTEASGDLPGPQLPGTGKGSGWRTKPRGTSRTGASVTCQRTSAVYPGHPLYLGSGWAGRCPRSSTWSPCAPASGPRSACGPPPPAPAGSTAGQTGGQPAAGPGSPFSNWLHPSSDNTHLI